MRIGLLVIATNKYTRFVPPLVKSAAEHFMRGHDVHYFCFTDGDVSSVTRRLPVPHLPWPGPTLYRYHHFVEHRAALEAMDYLFYCDADMRFVAPVGEEILGELTGTVHPGFYNKQPQEYSYERRPESTACVLPSEGKTYFAGGFIGGTGTGFLAMAERIREMVDTDQANGLTAIFHDESYLNRYFVDHPPETVLDPSYCHPEGVRIPFTPRLLALEKNHREMRENLSFSQLLLERFRQTRRRLLQRVRNYRQAG